HRGPLLDADAAAGFRSVAEDPVTARKGPGARDDEDIGFLADVWREFGIRRGEPDDLLRGGVENLVTGGALEIHRGDRAVGIDRNRQHEAAVDLAARPLGVVQIAEVLDFLAPAIDVERVANLAGPRAYEVLARTLVVLLDLARDLRFHARDDHRAVGELGPRDL